MNDDGWTETRFVGRNLLIGGGRLMVIELPGGRVSIAGLRGPNGLPSVDVERRDIDDLIAALMSLKEAAPLPVPAVDRTPERLLALLEDPCQFPYLGIVGEWMVADRPLKCIYCVGAIPAGERYFWHQNQPKPDPYHRRCAILAWLSPGDHDGQDKL